MKIKHLVLLFLVNCGHDSATADSKIQLLDTQSSPSSVEANTDNVVQCAEFLQTSNNFKTHFKTDLILLRRETITNEQIKYADKKIIVSDYKKSVKLKNDSNINSHYQYSISHIT